MKVKGLGSKLGQVSASTYKEYNGYCYIVGKFLPTVRALTGPVRGHIWSSNITVRMLTDDRCYSEVW